MPVGNKRRGVQEPMVDEHEPHPGGDGAGDRNQHHRPRPPLEDQQLHAEEHRGNRRSEDRAHTARCAGHEKAAPLDRGQVKELAEHRANRAARQDDRTFGTERSAAADADRTRNRLEHRHARLRLAAADQDGLHRLGNAMAADSLRPVSCHETDQ